MNTNQFTPAPWHMNQWSDYLNVSNGKAGSANVNLVEYYDKDAQDPEMIANARLIAAAPDMLQVLEDSWEVIAALVRGDQPDTWVMKRIEEHMVEVIAKAKNETTNA